MIHMKGLETFIEAFRDGVGSCRGDCACGVTFFNPDGGDWEDGELEELEARALNPFSPRRYARKLDETVSFISFEGKTYVLQCTCWHELAERVALFIINHGTKIADFLRAEKRRKQEVAEFSPVVEETEDLLAILNQTWAITKRVNTTNHEDEVVLRITRHKPTKETKERKLDL